MGTDEVNDLSIKAEEINRMRRYLKAADKYGFNREERREFVAGLERERLGIRNLPDYIWRKERADWAETDPETAEETAERMKETDEWQYFEDACQRHGIEYSEDDRPTDREALEEYDRQVERMANKEED